MNEGCANKTVNSEANDGGQSLVEVIVNLTGRNGDQGSRIFEHRNDKKVRLNSIKYGLHSWHLFKANYKIKLVL